MTRPYARLAIAATVSALVLTGCGSTDDGAAQDPAPSASSTASATPDAERTPETGGTKSPIPPKTTAEPEPVEVPEALQFDATTVNGDSFDGASIAGRPVVLWFWAPWCSVCRSQVPEVTGLAEEYGDEIAFVGVGSLDSGDAIKSFADDVPGLTHLSDEDGDLYKRFGIAEQSSFVVLDAEGGEVLRTGYADDDDLAGTVADLVG